MRRGGGQSNPTAACQMGTIAAKVGRKLTWDAAKEEFVNDRDANKLLRYDVREEYAWITI